MSWTYEHRCNLRIALLFLMVVAFMGPWILEPLYMPSEYASCSIRLDDDFCGHSLPGVSLFFLLSSGLTAGLFTGEIFNSEGIREFLRMSLLLLLPLLPIFSTMLMIPGRDHRRRQIFTIIGWVLAIGFGIFWGLINHPELYWFVWGIWLYTGLAFCALIFEIIVILKRPRAAVVTVTSEDPL